MHRFALFAALAACNTQDVVVGNLQEVATIKAIPNRDLDILFVVDSSGSMTDHQIELALNFPLMMDALGQLESGLPNLHIGVVTSDMGTQGSNGAVGPAIGAPGAGGCADVGDDGDLIGSAFMNDRYIIDIDDGAGGRTTNYSSGLRDVFANIAQVGANGCGFEQHLGAMRRALGNPANAGFLRPEANLAVVIIADEDDCSVHDPAFFAFDESQLGPLSSFRCTRYGVTCDQPLDAIGHKTNCVADDQSVLVDDVQPYIDALIATKGDERMVMVAGIVGEPTPVEVELRPINGVDQLALVPSCTFPNASSTGVATADPAVRLTAFLDAFPGRSTRTSICSNDLSTPLATIGASAKKMMGDTCIDASTLADASPDPGVQPACDVIDIRDSAPDEPRALPSCGDASGDCYDLVADPLLCPGDQLRIQIQRAEVFDDLWTSVRCQVR
jgi:hypothetical protein